MTLMEGILQANKKIDAIFCINDEEGVGVKIAQEQAGRSDEFFIVGVDGAPGAADALKEKEKLCCHLRPIPEQNRRSKVLNSQ